MLQPVTLEASRRHTWWGGELTLHECPLLVNMEHCAHPQPREHEGQCGDVHWELRVLHRHSELHNHTSGLERHNLQPQLPSSIQVRQRRRKGAFNLDEEARAIIKQIFHNIFKTVRWAPGMADRGCKESMCPLFMTKGRCPATKCSGQAETSPSSLHPNQASPGTAGLAFVRTQ